MGSGTRTWRSISLTLVLALLLSACGGAAESGDGAEAGGDTVTEDAAGDASPAADGEQAAGECDEPAAIGMAQAVLPPKFAMLTPSMTEELGFFDEFCIDAEIITFQQGINSLRALQAGEIEVAIPPSASLINAVGEGSPIVAWFSPASNLPQLILATEEIGTCEDFEGQTVATGGPGDLVHHLMQTYLDTCGLDIDSTDVEVFVGSAADYGPQLAQGVAQGSALHVDDKMVIEQDQDITLEVLQDASELIPEFHYQSLVSRQDYVDDNHDVLARAAAAMMKANRWMQDPANKEEMLDLAAEVTQRDREIMEFAYDRYVDQFPEDCAEALDEDSYMFTQDVQLELGNLDEPVSYDQIVDTTVCDDAEQLLE